MPLKPPPDQGRPPPDGGVRAVAVALASFLSNGIIFGLINSFGVIYVKLQEEIKAHEENGSSKAALVGSLAIGTTFLFSIIAGVMVDRVGIRTTAFLGGALSTIGMFTSSFFTTKVGMMYITYGLLFGMGASFAYTPSLVILGHYFQKYMGLVNGFVCAGSSVFTIFMPFLIKYLLHHVGLNYTFMLLSSFLLFLLVSAIIFKPLKDNTNVPKIPQEKKKKAALNLINLDNWKDRRYLIWAIVIPITLLGYFVPYVHCVKFVEEAFPNSDGSYIVLCIGVSSGVGRLIFGKIADIPKVNRIFLQQISFVMIGLLTMLMTVAPNYPTLMCIVLGMGLFDGCFITLLGPIAYDFCGKSGASQAIGCLLGLCSVPLTLGPPLAGLLFDYTGSYKLPFILSGIPPIVGGLSLILIRCVPQKTGYTKGTVLSRQITNEGDDQENETLFKNTELKVIINKSKG